MINLYPLNDLSLLVTLKDVDVNGKIVPLTTGPVPFFLSTANGPTATAADPSLAGNAVHTQNGVWLIQFDAPVLTYSLLNGLFAATPPYLIIQQSNGIRVYVPLTYVPARPATVS
jgi:hypothetical protein